jgi:hypothetical protein
MLPLQQAYEVPNSKINLDLNKFKIVNFHANFNYEHGVLCGCIGVLKLNRINNTITT